MNNPLLEGTDTAYMEWSNERDSRHLYLIEVEHSRNEFFHQELSTELMAFIENVVIQRLMMECL